MAQTAIVEITYVWSKEDRYAGEMRLLAIPILQFLDFKGQFLPLNKKDKYYEQRAARVHERALLANGPLRKFWTICFLYFQERRDRVIRKAISCAIAAMRKDYEGIELKRAWPSGSSQFLEPSWPGEVHEFISDLLRSKKIWFRAYPAEGM